MKKINVILVRTPAQKEIFEHELQGQLSDGNWENEKTDSRLWYSEVFVSEKQAGCSFSPKYPVNFNDDFMVEVLGERMIGYAKKVDPSYHMGKLIADLEELTEIVFGKEAVRE